MEENDFLYQALARYEQNVQSDPLENSEVEEDRFAENTIYEDGSFLFDRDDELEPTIRKAFGDEGLNSYRELKFQKVGVSKDKDPIRKKLYNAMFDEGKSLGLSDEDSDRIVKGMISNFAVESNFNVSAEGDTNLKDHAYGLGQWRKDRVDFIYGHASKYDDPYEGQGRAAMRELVEREKDAFKSVLRTKDPKEAAYVLRQKYERPHKSAYHLDRLYAETERLSSMDYRQTGGLEYARGLGLPTMNTSFENYKPTLDGRINPVSSYYPSIDEQKDLKRYSNQQKALNTLDVVDNLPNLLDKAKNIQNWFSKSKAMLGYGLSSGLSTIEGIFNGLEDRRRTSDLLEEMYDEERADYQPLLYQRTRETNVLN